MDGRIEKKTQPDNTLRRFEPDSHHVSTVRTDRLERIDHGSIPLFKRAERKRAHEEKIELGSAQAFQ
jgi:hypothetical protein